MCGRDCTATKLFDWSEPNIGLGIGRFGMYPTRQSIPDVLLQGIDDELVCGDKLDILCFSHVL